MSRIPVGIYRFFVYGNIFISLAAASLTYATRVLFDNHAEHSSLYVLVFFATLFIYSFDRIADSKKDREVSSPRVDWLARNLNLIKGFTVVSVIGILTTLYFLPKIIILALFPLGLITLLYSVTIPGTAIKIKSLYGAKTSIVSIVWAGATAYLPMLESSQDFFLVDPYIIIGRYLFVYALTLPFEVRDYERDKLAGVRSLAHIVGRHWSLILAIGTCLLLGGLSLYHYSNYPKFALAQTFSYSISALMISFSYRKVRADWYYSVLVDGMLYLPALAVTQLRWFGK